MNVLKGIAAALAVAFALGSAPAWADLSQEYKEAGFGAMPVEQPEPEANPIRQRVRRPRPEVSRSDVSPGQATQEPAPASAASSSAEPASTVIAEESAAQATLTPGGPDGSHSPAAVVRLKPENSLWDKVKGMVGMESDPAQDGVTASRVLSSAPAAGPVMSADYVIGPGDLIGITAWRDESLTRTVAVLPDGKISYPLVGEVEAAGRTVGSLKAELEKRISRYVTEADLTVEVKQSNSMLFYVVGRVNAPGRHVMLANTSVLQALAMAGGLNPFARKGDIRIFRNEAGATTMFTFDYGAVVKGKNLESNIELKRGDVIVVP